MENIKVDILYTDISCGHNFYKISVYNHIGKSSDKISRKQFSALFGIYLPTRYNEEVLDSTKEIIEDEWGGLIKIEYDDSMDIS